MSLITRISCDACQNATLYNTPHITVDLRPSYPGSRRDKHFCGTACLGRYMHAIETAFADHVEGYQKRRTRG